MRGRSGPVGPSRARGRREGPYGPHGQGVRPGRSAGTLPGDQRTRPYETLLDQIFASRTTSPDLGLCQILPFPA